MPNGEDPKKQALFRLQTLQLAVREIGPQVRWARSARFLWNLIRASVDGLLAQVNSLAVQSPEYQQTIEVVQNTGDFLHALLGYVAAGQAERVHQAIALGLEHLVEGVSPSFRVLVCYDWTPSNYGYLEEFREQLDANVRRSVAQDVVPSRTQKAAEKVPEVFAIVFLPAAERDSILLHSALAHEMGHGLSEVPATAVDPAICMPQKVKDAVSGLEIWQQWEFRDRCQVWQRELIADAWAVCLLGPAPLMSLYHLAPKAGPSRTHPDSNLRFRLMAACLEKLGFSGENQDLAELQWLPETLHKAMIESQPIVDACQDPILRLSHDHLKHNVQNIIDSVLARSFERSLAFTRDAWEADYAQDPDRPRHQLVRRILSAVPPDVVDRDGAEQVASLPAIVNAGWTIYTDNSRWQEFGAIFWDENAQQRGEFESRRRLQNLLLKAIDTVNIRREWGKQG